MSIKLGLESMKTPGSAHLRSMPNIQRSDYLNLLILDKEQKKLKRDAKNIEKSLRHNMNRLLEVEKQIETVLSDQMAKTNKTKDPQKPFATTKLKNIEKKNNVWETVKLKY